ncbi:MAG: hypothetical protein V7647_958 [Acidobacteriota bacterium]|jgi:hypothetical protein
MAPPLLKGGLEKFQDDVFAERVVFIHAVLRRSPDETFNYPMDDDPGDGRITWPARRRTRAVALDDAAENHSAAPRAAADA